MVITPPHIQLQVHPLCNIGRLLTMMVVEPGVHGVVVTGMQGIGVSTPKAAAVALATVGLDGVVHIPKGGILTTG